MKKKNGQRTRKISDFFEQDESVDFACMDVTDIDSDDSTSEISNGAMQQL